MKKTSIPLPKTYAEAVERLEAIVTDIERGTGDIDHLTTQLREAKALLAFCKEKLFAIDRSVNEILSDEPAAED